MNEIYENTVRFEETDAQGIVFYGNYATYQDETFTEYLDAIGYPYDEMRELGWDVHVVNMELSYREPARFRDRLINSMRVSRIERSSLEFEYECHNADGDLLVEGTVVHVVVDGSGSPTEVPNPLRDAIVAYQDVSPDGM